MHRLGSLGCNFSTKSSTTWIGISTMGTCHVVVLRHRGLIWGSDDPSFVMRWSLCIGLDLFVSFLKEEVSITIPDAYVAQSWVSSLILGFSSVPRILKFTQIRVQKLVPLLPLKRIFQYMELSRTP